MKIFILGAGKMVEALLQGLLPSIHEYYVYSPSGISSKKLANQYKICAVDENLIPNPDLILLGHKPQQINEVAKFIQGRFDNIPFVSMLAAIDEKTQINILGLSRLARIMPNLNVQLKKGVTLISSQSFTQDERQLIKDWLNPTGLCFEVNESEFDELTLLTGCGPALFYQFATYLSESFISLTMEDRLKLTSQVMRGSAELLDKYSGNFDDAIKDVASKGGVTESILKSWREHNFKEKISKGIESGKLRSEEIKRAILRS